MFRIDIIEYYFILFHIKVNKYSEEKPLMGSAALEGGGIDSLAADLEGKAGEEGERVYNHFIAYPLSLAGAIFFGVGNFIPSLNTQIKSSSLYLGSIHPVQSFRYSLPW